MHQGTNPSKFLSLLNDAQFVLKPLDRTLFPGIPKTLEAHEGFQSTHSRSVPIPFEQVLSLFHSFSVLCRSAPSVLAAVRAAQEATGSNSVVIIGHSLGGAIALLDSVYLPLHLPSTTIFTTSVFGLPRVGNSAFASYGTYCTQAERIRHHTE